MKTSQLISLDFNNPRRLLPLRLLLFICSLAAGSSPGALCAAEVGQANDGDAPAQTPAPDSQPDSQPVEMDPSIALKGTVWRTKAGIVFLKTPVGLLTLSSKTTLKDLKASHEVSFWVHDRNVAVEIRKRSDGSLVHRYLTGPMTPGPDSSKTLRCWTADGEQIVHYGTQETKLAAYHEGDQLTVEVDESQTIIGVHDLQFDLQISQTPPAGSSAHVLLSGSVSKLKSNFVFFRTPVGVVMINSKIGIPPVKVGHTLTLHIDDGRVNVEVLKTAKPAARSTAAPATATTTRF
ncbi:MAG TPA: hypothetical protein VFQ02_02925 [Nitrospira sp.]|nr:hypothetical protein [Nitrospira sp.]